MVTEIQKNIIKAKIKIMKEEPFYGRFLAELEFKEVKDCPSCYVDAKNYVIGYGKGFMEKLDIDQIQSVIMHEIMHLIFMHADRSLNKDKNRMNIATDLCINHALNEDYRKKHWGARKFPEKGLIPDQNGSFKFDKKVINVKNKSSEQVYQELPAECHTKYFNFDMAPKGFGDKEKNGKEYREFQSKLTRQIIDAAVLAKNSKRGNVPGSLQKLVDELIEPKVSWLEMLRRYISPIIEQDYTWAYPSKRSHALDTYLPSREKGGCKIAITIDTSGSMSKKDITEGVSETLSLLEMVPGSQARFIVMDCEVHEVFDLTRENSEDLINKGMEGGGGTSHVPVYKHILEKEKGIQCVINFTDGYTEFPRKKEFPFDSLWVITENGMEEEAPFGETIWMHNK